MKDSNERNGRQDVGYRVLPADHERRAIAGIAQ